jgi:hypothetical protein
VYSTGLRGFDKVHKMKGLLSTQGGWCQRVGADGTPYPGKWRQLPVRTPVMLAAARVLTAGLGQGTAAASASFAPLTRAGADPGGEPHSAAQFNCNFQVRRHAAAAPPQPPRRSRPAA